MIHFTHIRNFLKIPKKGPKFQSMDKIRNIKSKLVFFKQELYVRAPEENLPSKGWKHQSAQPVFIHLHCALSI